MRRAVLALVLAACGGGGSDKPAPKEIAPRVDPVAAAPPVPAPAFEVSAPTDKVIGIGRGESWTCVVRASGGVDCWGTFGIGRPEPTPRRIPGASDAVAISNDAACVLRKTGEVACLARDRLELVTVPGLAHVTQIGSGDARCFLHDDGTATCTDLTFQRPTRVPGLTDAIAISRGGMSLACAVRRGGQVVCGGEPDARDAKPWVPVAGLPPVRAFALTTHSTDNGACAILESGEARCFEIARADGPPRIDANATLAGLDATQLANATALALTGFSGYVEGHPFVARALVGGKVAEWGVGGMRVVPDLTDAVQLANGCAVRAQGSVVCWGDNANGAAGQPTTVGRSRRPPTKVLGVGNVAQVAMTDSDGWARTQDGRLFHWGEHGKGWALEAPLPKDAGAATAIALTQHGEACVIAGGGAVWCWLPEGGQFVKKLDGGAVAITGDQLGVITQRADGTFDAIQLHEVTNHNSESDVAKLPPAPGAIALSSWSFRNCARFVDGSVACISGGTWAKVPNLSGATDLAARHHACALRSGSLVCWSTEYDKPGIKLEKAPAVTDAVAIAGGDEQLCAVRARGRVTCFHDYDYQPQDVISTGAIDVEVAPAANTGCAIMRDRTVTCWGNNGSGVLGDGSVTQTDRPLGVRL